ncbi:perlucin-like protein isoform X2 [Saccostrea cucullata]|uniref:perlucin-like protein isoform X2 n=1 Tax=Saccostrea cuccullata TaxID=36930 RepID=UPI002ED32062
MILNDNYLFWFVCVLNGFKDAVSVSYHCDRGWDKFEDKCYRLFRESKNWHQARDSCRAHGSTLPIVSNGRIQSFIVQKYGHLLGPLGVYLAGTDVKREGTWEWVDGEEQFSFSTWQKGEPSNDGGYGHCLHMWKTYQFNWNDVNCQRSISNYLCSKTGRLSGGISSLTCGCGASVCQIGSVSGRTSKTFKFQYYNKMPSFYAVTF